MQHPKSLLMVGGSHLYKMGIDTALATDSRYIIVGHYTDAQLLAADSPPHIQPEAVLLYCAVLSQIQEPLHHIRLVVPSAPVLVVGSSTHIPDIARCCMNTGGYLHEDEYMDLPDALQALCEHRLLFNNWLKHTYRYVGGLMAEANPEKVAQLQRLKPKPKELLRLMKLHNGAPLKVLADKMNLRPKTINTHVQTIYNVLDIHSYPELMSFLGKIGEV